LPIPLMFLVDVERGKREGAALARETMAIAEPEDDGDNGSNDNDDGLETPRDEFRRLLE
jgi:hypothetical protein